jgi:predicted transglutaminase-like cysteine proteinase
LTVESALTAHFPKLNRRDSLRSDGFGEQQMRLHWLVFGTAILAICAPAQSAGTVAAGTSSLAAQPIRYLTSTPGPNILGTLAEPIRAERFAASLSRAFADASTLPAMQRLIAPARMLNRFQQIAYVQRAVAQDIRWESDATQWGQHDYWASASETLARGAGDMEDRAIVKMQALRALGFSPSDLFLTLARDRVGGPITVLMARVGGHFLVLDDTGGTPFPVEQRKFELQPLLSFGWGGAWVHVRPQTVASITPAANGFVRK